MKTTELGRCPKTGKMRYLVDQSVRYPGKSPTHIRRIAVGSIELARTITEIQSVMGSSLKAILFEELCDNAINENGGAGMFHTYKVVRRELGRLRVEKSFAAHYQAFVGRLRDSGKAENTVSNYKSIIRHILRKGWADGIIDDIPIRDYGIVRRFRSRLWTKEERTRIFNQLNFDDNLYWILRFSEVNPIRKMDLVNLRREHLVLIGEHAPYIRFQPRKTARSCPRPCFLVNIDDDMLARFADTQKRFPDCPYLFPAIYRNERESVERWEYQGNFKKQFARVCRDAGVSDFHFHDMKHVAITYMLKSGLSREVLKKRGINLSDRSIDVYDGTSAFDTITLNKKAETEPLKVAFL